MMGIETIRTMSALAAIKAAKENKVPLLVTADDMGDIREHLRYMPMLGDHLPERYELVESYFVDSSGFGTEGGAALDQDEFFAKVKIGRCYAVIETGQFQMYIGEFKKI